MEGLQLNVWSILIVIGAIQGFVLSIGLIGKNKPKANQYLSYFLLVTSIHLSEYAIAISGLSMRWPHTIASSYPLLFMMGPFFYLYNFSIFKPSFKFTANQLWHFIPALIVLVLFLPFYLQTGLEKVEFMKSLDKNGAITIPLEQFLFMFMHMFQTLIYAVLAYRIINKKETQLFNQNASPTIVQFSWLKKLTVGFVVYLIIYLVSLIILLNIKLYRVEVDYVILMLTAILIYAIGYNAIKQPSFFEKIHLPATKPKRNLHPDKLHQIKQSLLIYFEKEKPYLNEHLKIEEVAKSLNVQPHLLSTVINEAFGINFFEFTNNFRIEEAKAILSNPACADYKIIAVAYDAGFGNKATFNRVFKNFTGLTPSAYKSQHNH